MDISKILDFHRMVMQSEGKHAMEDETSCGPLCQHPACWDSNRRRERGVPHINTNVSDDEDDESDLPTVKYYNMLEDYGDSPTDHFPARFGGRPLHERWSSMRNVSHPLQSPNLAMATAPFTTPVSSEKTLHNMIQSPVRLVEVQEVFDKADLNSRWDETFVTRQYLVWVPNPKRHSKLKKSEASPRIEHPDSNTRSLLPKDLTEFMVPLEIKHQREETILFDEWPVLKKKQVRTQSSLLRHGTYPRTPSDVQKPDVDAEGIRELLGLPRDMLVEVLERTKGSDFVSREKIHGIIENVLSTARDRMGRDTSPHQYVINTSDVLRQEKLQLHHSMQRHMHSSYSMLQQPVFQLDDEDKLSSADSARGRAVSNIDSTPGRYRKSLPHYKKPLPSISADQLTPRQESQKGRAVPERRKIPSVSLGLPELPSGIRQTRTFTYNNRHCPDFTLVPVPTPPSSACSSGSQASEHGTTMRVNFPSVSDLNEADYYEQDHITLPGTGRLSQGDGALHLVSPALSTNIPQAPAGTPATFDSPTKSLLYRDVTITSSVQVADGSRGMPPSRDTTMSPGHKIVIPNNAPPTTMPAGEEQGQGLDTIRETVRENGAASSIKSSQPGWNVQFTEPPPPPSSPTGDMPAREGDGLEAPQQAGEGSSDYWPQVTESNYEMVSGLMGSCSDLVLMVEQSIQAEYGSQLGQSDLSSRGSNRSSLARRIMDEGGKGVESPVPPPPSPEPNELSDRTLGRSRQESKSREYASMEPLLEQNESEDSASPQKGLQKTTSDSKSSGPAHAVEPVIKEEVTPSPQPNMDQSSDNLDPVSKVMVSHVAPQPTRVREKLQQTFMNVDIPAEDISSLHTAQGSTGLLDFTPSKTTLPEMSYGKGSMPKSSPGPASPTRKSPSKSSPRKTGSGGKRKEKKEKEKKGSPLESPYDGDAESQDQ